VVGGSLAAKLARLPAPDLFPLAHDVHSIEAAKAELYSRCDPGLERRRDVMSLSTTGFP
jgi:hypothetical protein